MDKEDLVILLREILEFRKEVREKGNSDYERISNKDILLHLLIKLDGMESRITKTETKQKVFMWMIPILLTLIGLLNIL